MKPLKEQFEILVAHNIKSVVFELNEKEYRKIEKNISSLTESAVNFIFETSIGNQRSFSLTMYGIKATYLLKKN